MYLYLYMYIVFADDFGFDSIRFELDRLQSYYSIFIPSSISDPMFDHIILVILPPVWILSFVSFVCILLLLFSIIIHDLVAVFDFYFFEFFDSSRSLSF